MNHDLFRASIALITGTAGTIIASVRPWQEHIEWSLRILLLIFSIASVIVGLVIAARKKS